MGVVKCWLPKYEVTKCGGGQRWAWSNVAVVKCRLKKWQCSKVGVYKCGRFQMWALPYVGVLVGGCAWCSVCPAVGVTGCVYSYGAWFASAEFSTSYWGSFRCHAFSFAPTIGYI